MRLIPKASYPTVSPATFIKRLAAGILLINLFVLVLTGLLLRQSRLQFEERAVVTTQNLAQLLEQYIGGSIGKIDVLLLEAVDEVEKQLAGGAINGRELNAYMARQSVRLPELDGLRMANARGEIAYGTGVAGSDLKSIADRDYFIRLHDDAKSGLIISRPLISRVTGKWVLVLARRVNQPHGSFAGVVYGVIPLERFLKLFASVDVGAHGTIALRDGELGIIARFPEPDGVGSTVGGKSVSREFRELVKSGQNSGTYNARSAIDGIERTTTYRKFSSYPLYINVGLATDGYLAEWRAEAAIMSAVAAFFVLITLIASRRIWHDWTRRKAAVQALIEQKTKFRTIADYTYDWEFWLSPDGAFVHTSPSCKRITGYDADAFYDDPGLLHRVIHPDDQERFAEHRHEAQAAMGTDSLVFRIRHIDGTVRWLEHVCQPIINESGTFLGTRGSNRDITRRKQAEEALRNSKDYLDKIINSITDPIFVKDRAHRYILVNDAECAFIGYSREELIGRDAHDFFPKEQVEVFWEKDEIVFETEQENINEEEITTALGDKRVIVTKKSLYKDVSGNKYIVGLIRDITDSKEAERELRESEQRYRGLVELSPEAIYIHTGGKLIFANTEGAKLLGAERPEDLYGREALDFVHPDSRDFAQRRISSAFRSGEPNLPVEKLLVRLDGSSVPVEVASVPFSYRGENALQVIARDITDRRKVQDELLKAQKLESLGVLAGGIAHDFNNILTGIIGNLSIAKLQLDPSHIVVKRLELCEKAANQAGELTRQLLTFARGGEPVKTLMSLVPLIRDTVSFALRGSNVRSVIEMKDDLWCLEADESQLSQVLNNLLLNAAQAMPAGGEVTVRAANEKLGIVNSHHLPQGDYIRIAVEDRGCGIPQEDLMRVFDPYFTTKPQGSGLGLASVYSIVKRHGGAVEVFSTSGVGSSFAIHLPALPDRRLEVSGVKESAKLSGTGRVLVMDDEDFIRDVATDILHFMGYEVDSCADGREAVELFRAARERHAPFSAVILDLTIPGGMGGKEAAALILEIDPDAVLIVSSGYSNDPVIANFRHHGFSGVVSKPFDVKGLARELDRLIQKHSDHA